MRHLILMGLFLIAACGEQIDIESRNALITEYNARSEVIDGLVAQHNALIQKVNENLGEDKAYRTATQDYLSFVNTNKGTFDSYRTFIRNNQSFFETKGVDVQQEIATLDETVDIMDENAADFKEYVSQPAEQTTITKRETQSRTFRTIPLYR